MEKEIFDTDENDNENIDLQHLDENVLLNPGTIRKVCGFKNPSMMNYWVDEFTEYLHINRSPNGHRRYVVSDIAVLIRIRELCQDNGMRVDKAKAVLQKEGFTVAVSYEDSEETGLSTGRENNEVVQYIEQVRYMLDEMTKIIDDSEKRTKAAVREQARRIQDDIGKIVESSTKQMETADDVSKALQEQNELLKQQIEQQNQERLQMQKQMDEMAQQMTEIKEQTKRRRPFWQRKDN